MIELKELSKTYPNGVTALKDINITINDGEIFGIIGLSGAGKSTLIRCINFLEKPTSGKVIIDGQNLGELSKKELLKTRRNIGMIFQGFNLLSQRNVIKNICYPLEIAGVKKADALKRAEELLELVGLTDKAKAYPSTLSGGQKQRRIRRSSRAVKSSVLRLRGRLRQNQAICSAMRQRARSTPIPQAQFSSLCAKSTKRSA